MEDKIDPEVFSQLAALDELTDEELKYWSTPYFDELMAVKYKEESADANN